MKIMKNKQGQFNGDTNIANVDGRYIPMDEWLQELADTSTGYPDKQPDAGDLYKPSYKGNPETVEVSVPAEYAWAIRDIARFAWHNDLPSGERLTAEELYETFREGWKAACKQVEDAEAMGRAFRAGYDPDDAR